MKAIDGYSRSRGAFLKYAALLIKSRLIDYQRKEQRHKNIISLNTPAGEQDITLGDTLTDGKDLHEESAVRNATREEIKELVRQMREFGVALTDVADNCPKQQRTLNACRRALNYAKENPVLLDELLHKKMLPIAQLAAGSGVGAKNTGETPQIHDCSAFNLHQRV